VDCDSERSCPTLTQAVAPAAPLPGIHILIVDDDPEVLESAGRMLGDQGFFTATAFDGPGALQVHACLGPFEMLIAAVDMPEMDGPQLAQQIREQQPNLKVVYLTSAAGSPLTDRYIASTGDCAWPKTSDSLNGLTEFVATLFASSSGSDDSNRESL
jgi:CheY-like chemotaxis protein